jgi:hypothetical protein
VKRPKPEDHLLSSQRTIEVTGRDGYVWLYCRWPVGASVGIALFSLNPTQARMFASSLVVAADRVAGGRRRPGGGGG